MRKNHLRGGNQHIRLLTILVFVLAFVLSPLAVLTTSVKAESLGLPKLATGKQALNLPSEQPADTLTDDNPAPAATEFTPGTPVATNASEMKQAGAKLTWSATGTATIQDTYDVVVTQTSDVDQASGRLSGEPALPIDQTSHLAIAELDVSSLPDGMYYWQVSSCVDETPCTVWSEPVTVVIDALPPATPIAAVTSGKYDQHVVMTGTTDAATSVSVAVGDTTCKTTSDANGAWTCAFEVPFEYGTYDATITASDKVGNESPVLAFTFNVQELFVAPQITVAELPSTLEIVPVNDNPENTVFQQPLSVGDTDSANTIETEESILPIDVKALSTDGGVIQSSEDGWQVLGMPWYIWAGLGGMLSAGWAASSGRLMRLGSLS